MVLLFPDALSDYWACPLLLLATGLGTARSLRYCVCVVYVCKIASDLRVFFWVTCVALDRFPNAIGEREGAAAACDR